MNSPDLSKNELDEAYNKGLTYCWQVFPVLPESPSVLEPGVC